MAVKYMPTFGNQNEYFQAVAESSDIYNMQDYLKLSDDRKMDYNKAMSIYAQEGSNRLNKNLYNDLYDADTKFEYLMSSLFSNDEEFANNIEYFNQKALEGQYKRMYDSLSVGEKIGNTIGGIFAHIGSTVLDFAEGIGDLLIGLEGTTIGGLTWLFNHEAGQSVFDWTRQAIKDNELQDITKWFGSDKSLDEHLALWDNYYSYGSTGFVSTVNEVVDNLVRMAPMMFDPTGASQTVYFSSMAGNTLDNYIHTMGDNASLGWGMLYTALTTGVEFLTEHIVGDRIFGKGLISTNGVMANISSNIGRIFAKAGLTFLSEGLEESLAEVLDGCLNELFIGNKLQDHTSLQSVIHAGIIGGLIGIIGDSIAVGRTKAIEGMSKFDTLLFNEMFSEVASNVDMSRNLTALQAKYQEKNLAKLQNEHYEEFNKAIDADAKMNEKLAKAFVTLTQFANTIGLENFTKAEELLKESVQRKADMARAQVAYTEIEYEKGKKGRISNTLQEGERNASEVFNQFISKDTNFLPKQQELSDIEYKTKQGLRRLFPGFNVIFGTVTSGADGKGKQTWNGATIGGKTIFIDSNYMTNHSAKDIFNKIISHEMIHDLQRNGLILTKETMDELDQIMASLGIVIDYNTLTYDDSIYSDKTVDERKLLTRAEKQAEFYASQLIFNEELISAILTGDNKLFADIYKWGSKKAKTLNLNTEKGILLYNQLNTMLELYRNTIIKETANDKTTKTLIDKVGKEFFTEEQEKHIYASYQNDKIDNHMLLIGKNMSSSMVAKLNSLRTLYSCVKTTLKDGTFNFKRIYDISYYDENSELVKSARETQAKLNLTEEETRQMFKDSIIDILDAENLYYNDKVGKLVETTPLNNAFNKNFQDDMFKYYELREKKINEHIGDLSRDESYLRDSDLTKIENEIRTKYRTIKDVYDLEKLPKELEKIKNIPILYIYNNSNVYGEWSYDLEYIRINFNANAENGIENLYSQAMHTMIHETTHAVADFTDLFRGSSTEEMKEAIEYMPDNEREEFLNKILIKKLEIVGESKKPLSDIEEAAYFLYHLSGGEFNADLYDTSKHGKLELKYGTFELDNFFYIDRLTGKLTGLGDWEFLNNYNIKVLNIYPSKSEKIDNRQKFTPQEKAAIRAAQATYSTYIKNNIEDIKVDKSKSKEYKQEITNILGSNVVKYLESHIKSETNKLALYGYIIDNAEEYKSYLEKANAPILGEDTTDRISEEAVESPKDKDTGEDLQIEEKDSDTFSTAERNERYDIEKVISDGKLISYISKEIKGKDGKLSEDKLSKWYSHIEDTSYDYTKSELNYITKAVNKIADNNNWDRFDKISDYYITTFEDVSDKELEQYLYNTYKIKDSKDNLEHFMTIDFKGQEQFKGAPKEFFDKLYNIRDKIKTDNDYKQKSSITRSIRNSYKTLEKVNDKNIQNYLNEKIKDKNLSKDYSINELEEIRNTLDKFKEDIKNDVKQEIVSRETKIEPTKNEKPTRTPVRQSVEPTDTKKLNNEIKKAVSEDKPLPEKTVKEIRAKTREEIQKGDVNKIIEGEKALTNVKAGNDKTKKIANDIANIKYEEKYTKSTARGVSKDSYLLSRPQAQFDEQMKNIIKDLDDGELLPLLKELSDMYDVTNPDTKINIDRAFVYIGTNADKFRTTTQERNAIENFYASYARGAGYTLQEMRDDEATRNPVKQVFDEFNKTWDTDISKISDEDTEIIIGTSKETLKNKYEALLPDLEKAEQEATESGNDDEIEEARIKLAIVQDTLDAIEKGNNLKLLEVQYRNLRDGILSDNPEGEGKFVSELTKKLRDEYEKITKQGFRQMTPKQKKAHIIKLSDKIKNYRFFSMLSNPSTWINNYISNKVMQFTEFLTRKIETSIEERLQAKGDKTTQLRYFTKEEISDEVVNFVTSLDNMITKASGGNKYNSSIFTSKKDEIELDKDPVFKTKFLQSYVDFTNKMLDAGDKKFVKNAIVINLRQILQANLDFIYNTTLEHAQLIYRVNSKEELENKLKNSTKKSDKQYYEALFNNNTSELLNSMPDGTRDILFNSALSRAYQTYFRNTNNVVKIMQHISKNHPWFGLITSVIMPFPKVATNIMTTMFRYSPFEWINVIRDYINLKKVNKQGSILNLDEYFSKAKLSRSMSQAIIGTTNTIIGAMLAVLGKAIGWGIGKDKDDDYALIFGNRLSIKLSRFDGVTGALAIGAMLEKITEGKANLVEDFSKILYDYTLLSNLNDIIVYNRTALGYGENLAMNWANQYVPSVVRSLAKIIDPYQKQKSTNFFVKFAETVGQNIPGFSKLIPNKVDPYTGLPVTRTRTNLGNIGDNLAQIAYSLIMPYQWNKPSELEKEAERVGATTTGLGTYFTYNGSAYTIDHSEYEKYATMRATYINKEMTKLISSSSYKRMNNDEKKNALEKIYRHATELTKTNYWTDYLGHIRVFTTIDSYNLYKNYLTKQQNIKRIFNGYKGSQYITKK